MDLWHGFVYKCHYQLDGPQDDLNKLRKQKAHHKNHFLNWKGTNLEETTC